MARHTPLVCQHLENLSAKLLEKYQDIIRDYIRGRHGIYALYKKDRLYYVGLAQNLRSRLKQHLRDRHQGSWDRFSAYLVVGSGHIKELESLVLRIVKPKGNKQLGRLSGSQNLLAELSRELRRRQREELQALTGRRARPTRKETASQRVRKQARSRESAPPLAAYFKKPAKLRGKYKGRTYRARVRRDGWLNYNGYLYKSPSAAARDICKRACSGWYFWSFERAPGDWVQLRELKRSR